MERLRHDAGTRWTADSDAALLLELRALSGRILARATKTSSAERETEPMESRMGVSDTIAT